MKMVARPADSQAAPSPLPPAGGAVRVCMHVLGTARTDVRVMREATALAQAGYAVTVVDLERDGSRPRVEELQGVRLKHVVVPGRFKRTRFKPWFLVKMAGMILRGSWTVASTPAEVYHAHDDTALLACYVAARLHRKPLVFDAHELPLVQPNLTRWRRLTALARAILRHVTPRSAAVITVSAPIGREMKRLYGARRVELVRNIPLYVAPISSDRLRASYGLSPDVRIALYQGGLQENRSLEILVRAARYLDPGHMILMMGSGESQPMLERLIREEQVGDRVQIVPPVPYADLLECTASADVGLIVYRGSYSPNVQMCLPNKLFEYMMAGVPTVASQLDAVAEILQTYQVGDLVPSLEPSDVGRAISALLADRERRAAMRYNALAASQRVFRWEIERETLIALYQSLGPSRAARASRPEAAAVGSHRRKSS